MFTIKKGKIGEFSKLSITNQKLKEYVVIIPEFGANVNELYLNKNGKTYSIIDEHKTYAEILRNKWAKWAKLVPFPNRINNGRYTFNQKKFQLPINFPSQNHAIHGFVYDKKFKITKQKATKNYALVDLEHIYNKDLYEYPFNFRSKIRYKLTDNGFVCKTQIKNVGIDNMPLGNGWHPYFKTKGKVDNLPLKIPSKKRIDTNKRLIPNGKSTCFDKFTHLKKIGEQQFDTGFALAKKKEQAME